MRRAREKQARGEAPLHWGTLQLRGKASLFDVLFLSEGPDGYERASHETALEAAKGFQAQEDETERLCLPAL